jgi:hypothetical protein
MASALPLEPYLQPFCLYFVFEIRSQQLCPSWPQTLFFFFFSLWYWDLKSRPLPCATPPDLFMVGIFKIRSLELFAQTGFKLRSS